MERGAILPKNVSKEERKDRERYISGIQEIQA